MLKKKENVLFYLYFKTPFLYFLKKRIRFYSNLPPHLR